MDSPNKMASIITGRMASTGLALPSPSASLPQPHWKTAITTPNDAAAASRFITAAVSGTTTLRNATTSSRKARPTMTARNSGSLPAMTWVKSSNIAVCPPTYALRVWPFSAAGMVSCRRCVISWLVLASCGEVAGMTWMTRTVLPGGAGTATRGGHARRVADRGGEPGHGLGVAGRADRGDQLERAVEAQAEAVDDQVVGLACGAGGRVAALVGAAQPEREHRDRQRRDHRQRRQRGQARPPLHGPGPAVPQPLRVHVPGALGGQPPPLPAAEHPGAKDAQHRGQQGARRANADDHHDRGRDADAGQE